MKNKDLDKFKEFTQSYANRFLDCFCKDTGEKYPNTFSKFHYGRFLDYLDTATGIEIKETDVEAYNLYEQIMVNTFNKRIEQCKLEDKEKQKKAKEEAKKKKKKGKK